METKNQSCPCCREQLPLTSDAVCTCCHEQLEEAVWANDNGVGSNQNAVGRSRRLSRTNGEITKELIGFTVLFFVFLIGIPWIVDYGNSTGVDRNLYYMVLGAFGLGLLKCAKGAFVAFFELVFAFVKL